MMLTCHVVSIKISSLCRGIDKLLMYGFGCPPCMDRDLTEHHADYMLSN